MGRARQFKMADSDADEAENQALRKGEKRRQDDSDQESDDDSSSEANTDASDESFDENMVRTYHLDLSDLRSFLSCTVSKKPAENTCTCTLDIGADLRHGLRLRILRFSRKKMHSRLAQFTRGGNGGSQTHQA